MENRKEFITTPRRNCRFSISANSYAVNQTLILNAAMGYKPQR
jgi:hypothetical protein